MIYYRTMKTTEGERLKAARTHAQLTQSELARRAGVGQSAVGNIEAGLRGFGASVLQMARACGVDPNWLATGEGQMVVPANEAANVQFGGLSLAGAVRRMVPVISSVRAGTWGEIDDHTPDTKETFAVREANTGLYAFALRVEGDSMTSDTLPSFPEGTVLIVDPDRAPKAGDYVVAKDVDSQRATFKRLTTDGARWYLKPLNRDYRPIEIDDPAVRVIGVVVEYWQGGKL